MTTPVQNVATAPPLVPLSIGTAITRVASRCFKELAVSLAIGSIVGCFVAPAGTAILVQALMIQCAVSLFFHTLGAFAAYKCAQKPSPGFEKILSFADWMAGANFALLTGFNGQMLVHESGHALAALALYNQASPRIDLIPFGQALTQFHKRSLSALGKSIGPAATTCVIIASGPALTLFVSAALLAIGLAIKERHPNLSKYLITWALLDFLCTAHYAHSAIGKERFQFSHDFVHLSIFGLPPATATAAIVAIPVLVTAGVHCCKSRQK